MYVCWEIWNFCVQVGVRVSKSAMNSCTCCAGDSFSAFCTPRCQLRSLACTFAGKSGTCVFKCESSFHSSVGNWGRTCNHGQSDS